MARLDDDPGRLVDITPGNLVPLLDRGVIVVNGGNSYYHDGICGAKQRRSILLVR